MIRLLSLLVFSAIPARAITYYAHPQIISLKTLTIYYDVVGPLSDLPMTRRDLPSDARDEGEVSGSSCQHEINIPTSASIQATTITAASGNGGYQKALAQIYKAHPNLAGIYDVKTDIHYFSILFGIYHSVCVELLGRGYSLPALAPSPAAAAARK